MKLRVAYVCLNCEEIFNPILTGSFCPSCGSEHTFPISKFLNRKEEVVDGEDKRTNHR